MGYTPLKQGSRIRTAFMLGSPDGLHIAKENLELRRPNAEGLFQGYALGHGGDVCWVEHDDGMAAYRLNEFEAA
jgi:hypothetical protein